MDRPVIGITKGQLQKYADAYTTEELFDQAGDLIISLKTLTERMQDLIDNNREIASLLGIGIVVSVASAGEADLILQAGDQEGVAVAANYVIASTKDIREKTENSSEKDNG